MNELKVRNRVIVLSGEWLKKWRFVRKFMAMTKHTHLPPPPTCGGVSTINISYRQVSFELPLSSQLITVKINCTIKILFYSGGYWDRRVKRSEDEMKPPEFNFSPKFWLSVGFGMATGKLLAERVQVPMNSNSSDWPLRKFIELVTKCRRFLVSARVEVTVRVFSHKIFNSSILSPLGNNIPSSSSGDVPARQVGSVLPTHAIKILCHYRLSC